MHFICRSFSGNSESKSWSRYWENDPDDQSLKSTKGHLFALINISCDEEKELSSIGHDISYEFNQNYFNPENDSDVLNNLSQSINSIIKNPLYSDYTIDIVVAVVLEEYLYLATFGENKVILKRQDKISILLDGLNNQIETLVGPIRNQDRVFLSTNSFFEKITWAKIKQFLSDPKIQNIEENFLSAIYSLEDQKKISAAFIEIESDEPEELIIENTTPIIVSSPITDIKKEIFDFSKITKFFQRFTKKSSVFISHHETRETDKRKKITQLLAIILIVGLFTSLYFGIKKTNANKIEKQYQVLKTEIEVQITNINQTKSTSLDTAKELAITAQKTIEKMVALKIHQDQIDSYNSQLKTILSQTGSSKTPVPDIFYDTSKIIANSKFQKLIFNDNKIYLLDSENGRIDYINTNNKTTTPILASEKIKNTLNISFDKINLYLMSKESISLIEKDTITPKISLTDVNPTDFKFWNGAAYILDSSNQTIWKFNPNSTGFSKAQNWLKNDAKLELGASSLSINGKIWVLYQNGSIAPYLSGVESEFKPSQISQFTEANNLDVTQQKELLTFVDNNNIIYLYQKSGELLSKQNLGDLKINDIAFNEVDNVIYILCSDQKIYFIKF